MSVPSFLLYGRYEKKLIQPFSYKKTLKELELYFKHNTKFNIYSLAGHFLMSLHRFESNYVKSKDANIREIIAAALDAITSNALENEEEYARTLKYIMARANTGKDFLELSEEVQASHAQIYVLPEKTKLKDK